MQGAECSVVSEHEQAWNIPSHRWVGKVGRASACYNSPQGVVTAQKPLLKTVSVIRKSLTYSIVFQLQGEA